MEKKNVQIQYNKIFLDTLAEHILFAIFSECENLIRRMLVLEPSKRFSIEQIKNHRWMQMGEGGPRSAPPSPLIGYNAKVGEFNEQILRLMQSLGINQQKTMEVSSA